MAFQTETILCQQTFLAWNCNVTAPIKICPPSILLRKVKAFQWFQ